MGQRTSKVVVGALALTALLSACSSSPGAAAIVGDRTITQSELERAQTELAPLLSDSSPSSVLSVLLVAPLYVDAAAENGVGVSTEEARTLLETSATSAGMDPVPAFGEGAIEIARFSLAAQALQGLDNGADLVAEIQEQVAALDVTVNPRYGEMDPATGVISATTLPWIVPDAEAAAG
ncbi:MAG: hypothetical protein HGA44_02490 [Cellulomonadaceae bacterium]|nr:hypothetical protein [Cellulomonadaceae bacterium]